MTLPFLVDLAPYEAAHLAGVIVVLGGCGGALIAVFWHICTRGD